MIAGSIPGLDKFSFQKFKIKIMWVRFLERENFLELYSSLRYVGSIPGVNHFKISWLWLKTVGSIPEEFKS